MSDVYRDERAVIEARFAAAASARDEAWRSIDEQTDAIRAMNEQQSKLGLEPLPMPDTGVRAKLDRPAADAPLGELVRLAGELEAEAAALEGVKKKLGDLFALLEARRRGEKITLPLAPPPRRIPLMSFFLEVFGFRLWILAPLGIAYYAVQHPPQALRDFALLAAGPLIRGFFAWRRLTLLKWGKVATVREVSSDLTGWEWKNWPVRSASRWDVSISMEDGSEVKTKLAYATEEGYTGELTVRGVGYSDGIILYHARKPRRVMPIERFLSHPRPNVAGQLVAGKVFAVIGGLLTFGAVVTLVLGALHLVVLP